MYDEVLLPDLDPQCSTPECKVSILVAAATVLRRPSSSLHYNL